MVKEMKRGKELLEKKFFKQKLLKFKQTTCRRQLFGVKMAGPLGKCNKKAEHYIDELVT